MTAPVGSGGGANLGTAYGRVRVDYESSGVTKAVKDVEALQSTLVKADAAMAHSAKTTQVTQQQLNSFAAQTQKAADLVNKYTGELAKAQKRAQDMQKAGFKGQDLINAKALAGTLSRDLGNAKKQLEDWKKYVASLQNTTLPAPKANVSGVRAAVEQMKSAAKSAIGSGGGVGGGGLLENIIGGGAGGAGVRAAGMNMGRLAAGGIAAGLTAAGAGVLAASTAVFGAAAAGIGYTLTKGFQRLTALDQAATKLKALGYNAEQVKAVSASALEAVKGTAFGLDEAFATAAAAIASGIKPGQQLTDYLKVVADNAALAGISMQEMGYIFGKVINTGKLQGDEMNIFMERNIDIVGNLAKELQKPRAAIKQMVTDGQIDSATFLKAMNANAGAAVAMGNSISGSFTNMKAAISRVGAALLAPLFGQATGEASTFAKAIQWVTAQIGKLESWLGSHKEQLIDFWAGIAKGAIGFAETVTHAVGSALKDLAGFSSFISDIVGYMAGWDEFTSKIPGFGDSSKEAQQLRDLQKGLKGFSSTIDQWGQSAENSTGIWTDARTAVDKWAQSSKDALNSTADLGDKSEEAGQKTQTLTDALDKLQLKGDSVSKQIEGTNEQFAELLKTLREKKAPEDLIATIIKLREQFQNGGRQAKNFADAVRDFGDKSGSASDQADRLISSLQGLGLLPGADNLREYNKQLEQMTKWDNNLIDLTDTLGSALVNMDGTLNTSLKNGATLEDQITNIRKQMVQLVASGEASPDEAFNRTAEGLKILLADAGITGAEADKIIQKYLPSPQALAEALKKNTAGALTAAGMDPMQVQTELQLITQADDILKNIVGPDGALHVPTVLDTTGQPAPGVTPPGAPAPPIDYGANKPPGTLGDTGKRDEPIGKPTKVEHGNLPAPDAASKYQAPPTAEWWKVQLGMLGNNFRWPLGNNRSTLNQEQSLTGPEQEALKDPARVEAAWDQMDEITQVKLRAQKEEAERQGKDLAQAYAEGVFSGEAYLREAIKKLAAVAADGLGHSPAKYGPLSGKGWSYFRGQSFTEDWARGIESRTDVAQNAVAGTAQGATMGFGDQVEQLVGDLQQFSDLGKHILDFANQLSSITFGSLKIANDLSGGKLFPKTYVKDTEAKAPTGSRLNPWQPRGGTSSTATTSTAGMPDISAVVPGGRNVLRDTGSVPSGAASRTTAAIVSQLFPKITEIGGSRDSNTAKNTHDTGTSIDIAIPNYGTPEGKAYGDQINDFIRAHQKELGVAYTIWQNTWKDFSGNVSTVAGHMNHIDVHFQKDFIPNLQNLSDTLASAPSAVTSAIVGGPGAPASKPGAATPGAPASRPTAQAAKGLQLKDLGNGYYQSRSESSPGVKDVYRLINGSYYKASDVATGADGKPLLSPEGVPFLNVPGGNPTAPTAPQTPSPTTGAISPNAKGDDVARRIIQEGQRRGWSQEQILVALGIANQETGYGTNPRTNVVQNQNGTPGITGVYQQDMGYRKYGDPRDVNNAINGFMTEFEKRGMGLRDPNPWRHGVSDVQIPAQAGAGGYNDATGAYLRGRQRDQALATYNRLLGTNGDVPVNVTNPALTDIADNTSAFPTALDALGLPGSLQGLADRDKLFADAVATSRGQLKVTDQDAQTQLQHLDSMIYDANQANTPEGKAQANALGQIRSQLMANQGLTEGPTGLETAEQLTQGVSGIASSIFETFDAGLKAISATKNIGDILVRGVSNTQDVMNLIDNFQAYIELASKVAQTVSQITGFAAQLTGAGAAGDPSGATSAVSTALGAISGISGIVSQALAAVNTAIDIGQEVYKITTKYVGRFLTQWFGFPGASDIKYLLDEATGQLQVYTSENPQNKHTFNTLPRALGAEYPGRQAPTNNLYVFQGPGQDPRDTMDDAMFTIKSSGVGAFGYSGLSERPAS